MNKITEQLAKTFSTLVIDRKIDELAKNKPEGFHPIKKAQYRRECRCLYDTLEKNIERKRSGRIIGNKSISKYTKAKLKKLEDLM